MCAKSFQLCPAVCDPVDCSTPESIGLSRQEHRVDCHALL